MSMFGTSHFVVVVMFGSALYMCIVCVVYSEVYNTV